MHLVYIDDAKDDRLACFSAIVIPEDKWQDALVHMVEMRRALWESDNIYKTKEVHATEWVGGRGRVSPRYVPKGARVRLFNYILSSVALLPGAQLFNAAARRRDEDRLFEFLLNRINVNMSKSSSRAMLISDEGKSYDSLLRRMRHHNYIPSQYGAWNPGSYTKNIQINRIVEDISYRDSARSLFIQAADCCAYALLRRENPIPSKIKYGLHRSFYICEPIMVKQASGRDPHGVIR
ncbi:DUF3800 domain-containing protein [Pacificispira sp.]|uniref:DUF3800 domain-containing protein n=1 Tax=Pacificispira sp. TaxID=2888761 RepID=UPI003BAC030F